MHAAELRLKHALALEVRYNCTAEDKEQVAALWAAQPNIRAGRVGDLLYLVAAAQEPRRF